RAPFAVADASGSSRSGRPLVFAFSRLPGSGNFALRAGSNTSTRRVRPHPVGASMRFALLAVFLFALPARAADTPTAEERKTIDAIEKLGGKGEISEKLPTEARVLAKFEGPSDNALAGLKKHPLIGGVDVFDATRCSERGFAALKDLPNLRRLVVEKADLSPA